MSNEIQFDDERIGFDHPELDHLDEDEAKVYARAYWSAETTMLHLWETQNDRMANRVVVNRLNRRERNGVMEFYTELVKDLHILNAFENSGRIERTKSDQIREEYRRNDLYLHEGLPEGTEGLTPLEVDRALEENLEFAIEKSGNPNALKEDFGTE